MAEQVLGVGPALVLFANEVLGRHFDVVEEHFVDLAFAIEQLDGTHGDAGRFHVQQQEGNAGLGLALSAGAHQVEHPVAVLAQRGPGLLAVDDVLVAHALGARLDRGQVRARAGFAVALAPPHLAAGDAGQKALLLLCIAKGHDHRGHHDGAKRNDARCASQGALFFKQVLLHGRPAGAAKLFGPAKAEPALLAQNLGPALQVVARQAQGVVDLVGNFLGQVALNPCANFFAKGLFFGGECEIHAVRLLVIAWL